MIMHGYGHSGSVVNRGPYLISSEAGGPIYSPLDFAPSAAKLLNRKSPGARAIVVDGTSDVTFRVYNTDSTINGRSINGRGAVDEKLMPMGYSGPIRGEWVIMSPQSPVDVPVKLNFASGMSNLFMFDGQVFEFKGGTNGTGAFAIRWSEDGGKVWKQLYHPSSNNDNWYHFDFGTAASRIVEVIGCSQTLAINGYNFDTGNTIPAPFIDSTLPFIRFKGDSYPFGQGASDAGAGSTDGDNQKAISGTTRKTAEILGVLHAQNFCIRSNRATRDQANRSKFADRVLGGVYSDVAEDYAVIDAGPAQRDIIVLPSSVNDDFAPGDGDLSTYDLEEFRYDDLVEYYTAVREAQPSAIIVVPLGARAPHWNESDSWVDDHKNAFSFVFGATVAEQIANGAYLLDGTRRDGAAWVPEGAEGSNPWFGAVGQDTGHPTELGHLEFAKLYAAGIIDACEQIVFRAVELGYGTEIFTGTFTSIHPNWTDNLDGSYSYTGGTGTAGSLGLVDDAITGGKAYVVRLTVDAGMSGILRVRLGGSEVNQEITAAGDYSFVLDDRTSAGLIINGTASFVGTIRNISIKSI